MGADAEGTVGEEEAGDAWDAEVGAEVETGMFRFSWGLCLRGGGKGANGVCGRWVMDGGGGSGRSSGFNL